MSDHQQPQQKQWFVDREILLRADGNVTYITLSRPLQIFLFGLVLAVLGYMIASGAGLGMQNWLIEKRDRNISALEEGQKILVRQVDAAREEFLRLSLAFEQNQQKFVDFQSKKKQLEQDLEAKFAEIADLKKRDRQKRETLQAEAELMKAGLKELDYAIEKALLENTGYTRELADLRESVRDGTGMPDGSDQENHFDLSHAIEAVDGNESITRYVQAAQIHVDAMRKERDAARTKIVALNSNLDSMGVKLGNIRDGQDDLIKQFEDKASRQIKSLESTLVQAGIEPAHIYRKLGSAGSFDAVGGPLQSLGIDIDDAPTSLEQVSLREDLLDQELNRWNNLHEIMTRLPLASPVDSYYISSKFGKRRDPFTKKWAMHKGIDMAARKKTPILATAPGKVVFAGYKGAYGRMVEIDHGLGIRTRYGHLHKILVKRDQEISFRDRIALMGSTGRSTGSHLHYEVVYDGESIDPAKFIEAGRHVFKN